jgi:hypothetical protein
MWRVGAGFSSAVEAADECLQEPNDRVVTRRWIEQYVIEGVADDGPGLDVSTRCVTDVRFFADPVDGTLIRTPGQVVPKTGKLGLHEDLAVTVGCIPDACLGVGGQARSRRLWKVPGRYRLPQCFRDFVRREERAVVDGRSRVGRCT